MAWGTVSEFPVLDLPDIEVLATREKVFEVSGYCTLINNLFIFRTANGFWLLLQRYDPLRTLKAYVPELD